MMDYIAKCVCVDCGYVGILHTKRDVINFWMKHFEECNGAISVDRLGAIIEELT